MFPAAGGIFVGRRELRPRDTGCDFLPLWSLEKQFALSAPYFSICKRWLRIVAFSHPLSPLFSLEAFQICHRLPPLRRPLVVQ